MFTLETLDDALPEVRLGWVERGQLYVTMEQAIRAASDLWGDDDHHYAQIRVKETRTVCTLIRPGEDED